MEELNQFLPNLKFIHKKAKKRASFLELSVSLKNYMILNMIM